MPRYSKNQLAAIKSLAVRYSAWNEANAKNDDGGRVCWGYSLLKSLEQFPGVELSNPDNVRRIMGYAQARLDAASKVEVA